MCITEKNNSEAAKNTTVCKMKTKKLVSFWFIIIPPLVYLIHGIFCLHVAIVIFLFAQIIQFPLIVTVVSRSI